ncbi:methyltransferase domain-containing protein [bacterium]|nr:methyltransferase domain-containing protein [bacterium]
MTNSPDYVRHNRTMWNALAKDYAVAGEEAWVQEIPTWGIWGVSEEQIGMFPKDLVDKDVIELGCGTAYVSAWLIRRGARVVGIDSSEAQLATARHLQQQNGFDFPLILGNAEQVPYPDESFDFAISEYGACLWADPRRWTMEAWRLLRPGGRLAFLTNSFLLMLCLPDQDGIPATDRLLRPAFGMYRVDWPDEVGIEFHLSHGDWIRLLRQTGFEIEDLVEIQPEHDASTRFPCVSLDWARQWPCEEVWKVRKPL